MENFQELRFADLAQRLLRDVTRLVRPMRDARHVLLATPPNDPNQLGLAILVSLVKLGELATVLPGPGLLAFAAVVVLTILATTSFDPAQIWETPDERA